MATETKLFKMGLDSSQAPCDQPHRRSDRGQALRAGLFAMGALLLLLGAAHAESEPSVTADCAWHGIKLYGKVQVVESFPDIKVQKVTSFPDLKVLEVESFPDACGRWHFVDSFPDFKIQYVDSFPDLKIELVKSFPGLP